MRRNSAFTLIELSIVLVIIALIAGGVLMGKDLIVNAQLRKHITEVDKLNTSLLAFRDKYGYLPGDHPRATNYWPSPVVNGDGDGKIVTGPERVQIWLHLQSALMFPGMYDGQWAPGPYIGQRVPPSPLGTNIGWWVEFYPGGPIGPGYYDHIGPGNMLLTGLFPAANAGYYPTYTETLLPETVWNIDAKIDDGNGLSGIVETWDYAPCVNITTGVYNLGNTTTRNCWFWQRLTTG